jgi:hypothetical protein
VKKRMNDSSSRAPVIFCSYATADEDHLARLVAHLALLKRENKISEWHNRKILPGDDWNGAIIEKLELARVFLLLVSADFIASDYIWGKELKRALERNARTEAVVVPIIVKPVDWHSAPFGKLQALPTGARPVTLWGNRDEAWADVAKGIRLLIEQL